MALQLHCTVCGHLISHDEINIAEGMVQCASCGTLHKLGDLRRAAEWRAILDRPAPAGTHILEMWHGTELWVSARDVAMAGFMTFFTLFWNAITWLLVTMAVTRLLGIPLGSEAIEEGTGQPMSEGETWFLLLFMTPFVAIGIFTAMVALLSWFGRTAVVLTGDWARARTGVGPLSLRTSFSTREVTSVKIGDADIESNGNKMKRIEIETPGKSVKLGTFLTGTRRKWLAAELHRRLIDDQRDRRWF